MVQEPGGGRYPEAARLYVEAFSETPSIAGDLKGFHRYNAACGACRAAAEGAADASEWRRRALDWLRADLSAREKAGLAATLADGRADPDLAEVRDRPDSLPEGERADWAELWSRVDVLLQVAGALPWLRRRGSRRTGPPCPLPRPPRGPYDGPASVREIGSIPEGLELPRLVEPEGGRSLVDRIVGRRDEVRASLLRHGALLFRGFDPATNADLERIASAFGAGPMGYTDRVTRRSRVQGNVFTSTTTSPRFRIVLHNESTFASTWPRHILFHCRKAAAEGGATPLADVRRVYRRIDPEVRARFAASGVLYVRNFGAGPGMGWAEAFQVKQRAELEAHLGESAIEFEWLDGGRLRTRQTRPAALLHPETNEPVWFNHAVTLHVTSLEPVLRDTLLRQLPESDLPHQTFYGDGQPIEREVIEHLRSAYVAETIRFPWRAGDLLLIDNLLVAHARDPYKGEREIVAVLASPCSWGESRAVRPDEAGREPAPDPEEFVRALAAELLERPVGPTDDLLRLGADSIVATQIITRVFERYGRDIPVRAFFAAPNAAALAALIRSAP